MSEPEFPLRIEGEKFAATRENTILFTFMGFNACYDHIFVVMNEDPPEAAYIWCSSPDYEEIANFMDDNDYTMHLNLPEAFGQDITVFERHHYSDVRRRKGYPKEWKK